MASACGGTNRPMSTAENRVSRPLTALFALAPFIWMLSLSLKPPQEIFQPEFHLWPRELSDRSDDRAAAPLPAQRRLRLRRHLSAADDGLPALCLCLGQAALPRAEIDHGQRRA